MGLESISPRSKANLFGGLLTGAAGLAHGANVFKAISGEDYGIKVGDGQYQTASSMGLMTGAARAGTIIGGAGEVLAGTEGAIAGFSKGGGRGIAQGIGSITGAAAALDPEPISKSILMGVALASSVVSSMFGDPRANRADEISKYVQSHQNAMPTTISRDFDISGSEVFGVNGFVRPVQQTNINVNVTAMNSKSFQDHATDISDAVYTAMNNGHKVLEPIRQEFAK